MSTTPEEYFGPHAKRWTSPTGQVFSLQPVDYDRMVNIQMELDFNARELDELAAELLPVPDHEPERPRDDIIDPETAAETKVPWPNVQLHHASLVKGQESGHIDGWMPRPVLADGDDIQVVSNGKVSHFTLRADGSIAEIHPVQDQAGEPAARHLKPRRRARTAPALVLLVIITIIGVAAVAGVVF